MADTEACDGAEQCRLLSDKRKTSFNQNSPYRQHTGGAAALSSSGEEPGAWTRGLGVTSFSSCPNQNETVSHLSWHRIRMHLTGSAGHPRHGQYSHAAFQRVILYGQGEFISWDCQVVHPDCDKPFLFKIPNNSVYLAACSRGTFLCWQPWMFLQMQSQ